MNSSHNKNIALILIWTFGLILIVCIFIKGAVNELTPIRSIIGNGDPSRHVIPYPHTPNNKPRFNIIIDYEFARKGPLAILQIHDVSEGPNVEFRTKPVQIFCNSNLELVDEEFSRYGLKHWGNGVFWIRVTEDEMGIAKSYIEFINADEDYESEILIYQPEFANSRAMPIKTGAYLIDFNETTQQWEIGKYRGALTFWGIRHKVRNLLLIVIMNLLLLTAAVVETSRSKNSGIRNLSAIAAVNVIIAILTYINTSVMMSLMPKSVLLMILNCYIVLILIQKLLRDKNTPDPTRPEPSIDDK